MANPISQLNLYLTRSEQDLCMNLDARLIGFITYKLLPQGKNGVNKVHLIFSSFMQCECTLYATITDFFIKALQSSKYERFLEDFAQVHEKDQIRSFFAYADIHILDHPQSILREFRNSVQNEMVPSTPPWKERCCRIPRSMLDQQQILRCVHMFSNEEPTPSKSDVQEFIDHCAAIRRTHGEEVCNALTGTIALERIALADALSVLKRLHILLPASLFNFVVSFQQNKSGWKALCTAVEQQQIRELPWQRKQKTLPHLMQRFAHMPYPLPNDARHNIEEQYRCILEMCASYANETIATLASAVRSHGGKEVHRLRIMAIGIAAMHLFYKKSLHPTQVLTVLGQLSFSKGSLAQVKTGEGKSMIIALLSFLLAVEGHSVHIISSSQNLAIRDQEYFAPFFTAFGITTNHLCELQPSPQRFQAPILYGTATDFEFAIMREMLYMKPLFQEQQAIPKKTENLVLDCVDCPTLFSSCTRVVSSNTAPRAGQKNREASLSNSQVFNFLGHRRKRFDCVIVDEVDNLTIDTLLHGARLASPAEVSYDWVYAPILSFVQKNKDGSLEELRKYLEQYADGRFAKESKKLANGQLAFWQREAVHAQYALDEGHQYVILPSKEGKKACIIDAENTGRLMHDSRWSGGMHEFVETKHAIPVDRENLTPLSLSHPVYYDMYDRIYGLTGTLGDKAERDEIREIYHIDTFDVPTHVPSQRKDFPPIIVSHEEALHDSVLKTVKECRHAGRPLLLLCDTVKSSTTLSNVLKQSAMPHELLNEVQKTPEPVVLYNAGKAGAITVATNTAGRGTDIQLDETALKSGGLHVLITFFPSSLRTEEQARGRAGRQGQPGSSAIVVVSQSNLETLLNIRAERTALLKERHLFAARFAHEEFRYVQQFFSQFRAFRNASERIVETLADQWTQHHLLSNENRNFNTLMPRDRTLAKEVFALLSKPGNKQKWRTLLHIVHERVEAIALEKWSRLFRQQVDALLNEQVLSNKACETTDALSQKMRLLFNEASTYWNVHLDIRGEGINAYLEQIIAGAIPKIRYI